MQNFDFYSPTYFAFGKGKEKETGTLVKRFGGTKSISSLWWRIDQEKWSL